MRRAVSLSVPFALLVFANAGVGAPPAQFEVWGKAGANFAPVPTGWTEQAPEDSLPALVPTAEERARGYVIFARDPFELIYRSSQPAPSERTMEIKTFASIGEYEPVSFALLALDNLREVRLTVGDLRSEGGGVIPADHIDARIVRCVRIPVRGRAKTYELVPWLLEKRDTFAAREGEATQVWLTLKVPDDARPGDYAGVIRLQPTGREATGVKVLVRVLPIRLPPASIEMAMSYRPSDDDAMLHRELVDLREHGINAGGGETGFEVVTRDRVLGDDDIAATRAHCKRIMDAFKQVFGDWRFPVTFGAGHQIIYYWDQQTGWFAHWEHSPQLDSDLLKAIGVVVEEGKAEGWPEMRAYLMDEAGAHNLLDEAVHYYRLVKQRVPDVPTYTTIGGGIALGHDEIGALSPWADFLSTNRFTEDIARRLVERGKPYGVYNGSGSTPAGARFFFGCYGWKTGAREILQWAYNFGTDSVFQGNGFRADDAGYVCYADDGPLPSIMFEAVREGIDDYRYADLLWRLIAAAKASGKPAAQRAGEKAQDVLSSLLGRTGWQYQALAYDDRTPPPDPSALRKWRWAVAQQIVKLQAIVGDAPPRAAARPSPLELPWAPPDREEVSFGDELLPASDFETAMKPWRIEAWKGPGVGDLDATEAHGGKQSVRIDVAAEASSDAVTVLVWPKWGEGGLNIVLGGERVYEFSAWVKLNGRTVPPQLRVALPADATGTVRSGEEEPGPNGWQRISTRVETTGRAEPSYIAVWVQGPGTVSVDDLSLREVIPPPLAIALDQSEYDGRDRVGVAQWTVAKHVEPARLRFTLASARGDVIERLEAPFRSSAPVASETKYGRLALLAPLALSSGRLVFDPSVLPVGQYEVKAELLDRSGTASASEVARFRRVAGPFG